MPVIRLPAASTAMDGATAAEAVAVDTERSAGGGVYRRAVTVEYRAGPAGPVSGSGDYALATVRVVTPRGGEVVVSKLLTRVNLVAEGE